MSVDVEFNEVMLDFEDVLEHLTEVVKERRPEFYKTMDVIQGTVPIQLQNFRNNNMINIGVFKTMLDGLLDRIKKDTKLDSIFLELAMFTSDLVIQSRNK